MREHDVVVVGSGAGGLTGALRAAENGLSVLLLEKAEGVGGTAALTGGGLWAPGNAALQAAGVDDDLDEVQAYLDATVGDRTPRSLQQAFLREAAPTVDWLARHEVTLAWMPGFPDYHPELRGARATGRAVSPPPLPPEAAAGLDVPLQPPLGAGDGGPSGRRPDPRGRLWGGQSLVARLALACRRAGVEIRVGTPFLDLLTEGDRVTGVLALVDGVQTEIRCTAGVLLAAGGFEHNPAMRARWQLPAVEHGRWSLGVAGNTGDAIAAGLRVGAATDLLEDAWWTPAVVRPDGRPSFLLYERMVPMGFMVDARGDRWINEGTAYNSFGQAMRAGGADVLPTWHVFDQAALDRYGYAGLPAGDDPQPWLDAGCLHRADSLPALAQQIGTPHLAATAARWDAFARSGVDEDFHRGLEGSFERQVLSVFLSFPGAVAGHDGPNPALAALGDGPFYAAPVVLGDLGTKGGLVCDENGQVTRPDGSTIPGLYACGNTMASMMGHAYPGPGSCITPGMTFGRLAADAMKRSP